MGDGDFMMIMQELSTVVQYGISLIIIVADNSGWMAIKDLQTDAFGAECAFGNDFKSGEKVYSPDFYNIAKSFGLNSYKADSKNELETALKDAVLKDKPSFISVNVTREYPYTGGKTFGWWDVPVPAYMEKKRKDYLEAIDEETI